MFKKTLTLILFASLITGAMAQTANRKNSGKFLPSGYWPLDKSQPLIDKTETIRLAPDLTQLSDAERSAVAKLLAAGQIFQRLYEEQRHKNALDSFQLLTQLDKRMGSNASTQNLLILYRLNQGPITTTLENKREPFLPVDPPAPGKTVFPWGVQKEEMEAFLSANPEKRAAIMDGRTVVRRSDSTSARVDLSSLTKYPVLDTLHPGLRGELNAIARTPSTIVKRGESTSFYAVPYAVAYADEMIQAHLLLNQAAALIQGEDEEFSRYLRNRARDLLTNDYESGDASWVTGRFKNLNAQIGSYETYDDELYGVKTFFGLSLMLKRTAETTALRQAMKGMQNLEESLPYEHHKRIREDIPVGVYDVIADFGQTRGGNTATILPNESYLARRYGRTILLRANIMRDANIFSSVSNSLAAAIGSEQAAALTPDGNFYRTLWHEVGHYLGIDRTQNNRELDEVLQEDSDVLEEMKADLVSLFVAEQLHKQGYYTDAQLRSVYAGGVLRVLQNNKPRRDQPYNTMQLMQWNFFLENGLLSFTDGKLQIHYDRYHSVISKMLAKTLDVQYQGDKAAADRFIEQYTVWDDGLHGLIAKNIREQQRYRFRLFKYGALGE